MKTSKRTASKERAPASKVAAKKRLAILKAAVSLFSQHGFKRTSVELIAEAAAVAKPTIYAHFEDKDALFAAVCELFMEQILEGAQAARGLPTLPARILGILRAKFTFYFEVVLRSPYAEELIHASTSLAGDIVARADAEYKALLVEVLSGCEARESLPLAASRLSADELAEAFLQVGYGAGYNATSAEAHAANLQRLVWLILQAG